MVKGRLGKKPKNRGKPGKLINTKKIQKKSPAKKKASEVNPARGPAPAPAPASTPAPAPAPALTPAPGSTPALASTTNGSTSTKRVGKGKKEMVVGERTSGFIFMCNGKTKSECYHHHVFGLPSGKLEVVKKIKEGTKLFLFDFDLKLLYGIYKAVGTGGKNLEPTAFGGKFPAQVRFKIFKDCLPVPESTFKHVIEDNYIGKFKFKPELSSRQVRKLFSLFRVIPAALPSPSAAVDDRRPVPSRRPPPKEVEAYDRRPVPAHRPHPEEVDTYDRRPIQARRPLEVDAYDRRTILARRPPPEEVDAYDRRPVHARRPPPEDPYVIAPHPARVPLPRHVLPVSHPVSDEYGMAAHLARAPPVVESRHRPAVGPPPPSDPYYLADARRAYLPENPVVLEHELYSRYRTPPEMIPRDRLGVADPREYRTIVVRESEMVPRSDRLDEYYALRAARLGAVDLPPPTGNRRSGYEDPNWLYADNLPRSVSGIAPASAVPVSSLYSFAGAAASYQAR